MQTRGNTNKSPIKLNAVENKLTRWFVYEWGKPTWQKSHQVISTPENPLLSQQTVTSKEISVPYTQLDLFCSDNLSL